MKFSITLLFFCLYNEFYITVWNGFHCFHNVNTSSFLCRRWKHSAKHFPFWQQITLLYLLSSNMSPKTSLHFLFLVNKSIEIFLDMLSEFQTRQMPQQIF